MLIQISIWIIPVIVLFVVIYGILNKTDVYSEFIKGAKEGLNVVVDIAPTIIGLLVAVGVLRASGIFDIKSVLDEHNISIVKNTFIFSQFEKIIPGEIIPLILTKLVSSSAATALLIDIFSVSGPDSYVGRLASVICSCTETIFYVISVYYMEVKVKKSRWTVPLACLCVLTSIIAAVVIVNIFMR